MQLERDCQLAHGRRFCSEGCRLDHKVMSVDRDPRRLANPLTFSTFTIASVVVSEAGRNGESMTTRKIVLNSPPRRRYFEKLTAE